MLIVDGVIADLGAHIAAGNVGDAEIIDCGGRVLAPGLIDMMVFAGEPGHEHRETLATASRAAAAGGVTTIVCMPNTEPVIDDVALVDFILRRARDTALVNVHPMAAMTKGLTGEEMTEIGLLHEAGAIAFSNGKTSLANAKVMRNVLAYAKDFGALIVHHLEDPTLAPDGRDERRRGRNQARACAAHPLRPRPSCSSATFVSSSSPAAATTRAKSRAAPRSISYAPPRREALPVTCGVSINHLTLNENDIGPYRTFFKMNPPLRSEDDRRAMVEGVASGDIDVIVSAHDPRGAEGKRRPFAEAADGAVGLETLLGAALRLYHNGEVELNRLLEALTASPAGAARPEQRPPRQGRACRSRADRPRHTLDRRARRPCARSRRTPRSTARGSRGTRCLTFVAGRLVYNYADQSCSRDVTRFQG